MLQLRSVPIRLLVLVALLTTVALSAEDAVPLKTLTATRAAKKYSLAIQDAEAAYVRALVAAKQSYLKELDGCLSTALKSGNLDEANAINSEKRRITEELTKLKQPRDNPAAELTKWQGTWNDGDTTFQLRGNQLAWADTVAVLKVVAFDESAVAVDLLVIKGPETGKVTPAIFRLDGDTLQYCGAKRGARPTEFRDTSDWMFRTWKRASR